MWSISCTCRTVSNRGEVCVEIGTNEAYAYICLHFPGQKSQKEAVIERNVEPIAENRRGRGCFS